MSEDFTGDRKLVLIRRLGDLVRRLAETGQYKDLSEIKTELIVQGHESNLGFLEDPELRRDLDKVCVWARQGKFRSPFSS